MCDPLSADQWSLRYVLGRTPWDLASPHPELSRRIEAGLAGPGRAFVPGCGRGHDAAALSMAGWDVVAVDFAEELRTELGRRMQRAGGTAVIADALQFEAEPFDLVFDHTFFCALDPDRRAEFGHMADRLTERGARVAAVVFPIGHDGAGPPWGVDTNDYSAALGPQWLLDVDEPAENPVHRSGEARWAEWVKV